MLDIESLSQHTNGIIVYCFSYLSPPSIEIPIKWPSFDLILVYKHPTLQNIIYPLTSLSNTVKYNSMVFPYLGHKHTTTPINSNQITTNISYLEVPNTNQQTYLFWWPNSSCIPMDILPNRSADWPNISNPWSCSFIISCRCSVCVYK